MSEEPIFTKSEVEELVEDLMVKAKSLGDWGTSVAALFIKTAPELSKVNRELGFYKGQLPILNEQTPNRHNLEQREIALDNMQKLLKEQKVLLDKLDKDYAALQQVSL